MFVSAQTVDNIALLDVAAVNAALSGAFDDRIKELRGILKDIEAQNGKVKSLADADKLKADAEASLRSAKAVEAAANAAFGDLAKREEAASAAQRKADADAVAVAAMASDLQAKKDEFAKQWAASNEGLAEAYKALDAEKAKVEADRKALESERAAFNAKLAALKA